MRNDNRLGKSGPYGDLPRRSKGAAMATHTP